VYSIVTVCPLRGRDPDPDAMVVFWTPMLGNVYLVVVRQIEFSGRQGRYVGELEKFGSRRSRRLGCIFETPLAPEG